MIEYSDKKILSVFTGNIPTVERFSVMFTENSRSDHMTMFSPCLPFPREIKKFQVGHKHNTYFALYRTVYLLFTLRKHKEESDVCHLP